MIQLKYSHWDPRQTMPGLRLHMGSSQRRLGAGSSQRNRGEESSSLREVGGEAK